MNRPIDTEEALGSASVAELVRLMEQLTDEQRLAVAEARRAVKEDYHEAALRAAAELLVGRGDAYARTRARVANVHVPEALEEEPERWTEVARLVQLAVDEGVLAAVVGDVLHPNHVRELYRSWWPVMPGRGSS